MNIFKRLLTDENHYTDLLCNLLILPEVYDAFVSILDLGSSTQIDLSLIKTRTVTEENGKPDITYEDNELTLLVEVKTDVNRGLTKHQPTSYLRSASNGRAPRKVVIFLIPVDYRHKLELRKRYLAVASNSPSVEFRIAFWGDLAARLQPSKSNLVLTSLVESLKSLSYKRNVVMDQNELANLETSFAIDFYENLKNVVDSAAHDLKKDDRTVSFEGDDESYGYMLYDDNQLPMFWFGIWNKLWKEERFALAAVCNRAHKNVDKFKDGTLFQGEYFYVPLRGVHDGGKVVESFVDLLRRYL